MIGNMLPSLGEAYYILEWMIRLAMLVAVPLRRAPAATRSWLLLIFFLPVPGLLLFLAIGRPHFPRWRTARFDRLRPFFTALAERLDRATDDVALLPEAALLARRLGGLPMVGGNSVTFIDDYDAMIDSLVRDIDAARHHVRLLVYIFADDAAGMKVIDALARARARGVACHVLIDPVGSHKWIRRTLARLHDADVDARAVLPFRLLRGRTRRDMRNHRKIFLVDGVIGYTGSQNIVSRDFRPGVTNRELVARVTGPVVAELNAIFIGDWFLETEAMLADMPDVPGPTGDAHLQLLPSGADYPLHGFEALLVWQIHRALDRVIIVTPYLIPSEDMLGAMRTAAARGVRIDLVVSAVVDQRLVNLAQSSYYDELLAGGVRIHRFRDYLLHAKNVSIDGTFGIVGSSNVDIRSFQLNEEASLLLFDPSAIAALEGIQRGYLAGSDELEIGHWRRRPAIRKFAENVARLVDSLL